MIQLPTQDNSKRNEIIDKIVKHICNVEAPRSRGILTPTRVSIIQQVLLNKKNKEISQKLSLKEKTIKWHLTLIYKYFKTDNRRGGLLLKLYMMIQ
jgi:DNA-binding CsgD family transcriptional regulator